MRRLIALAIASAAFLAALAAGLAGGVASSAPIDCPNGQVAVHTETWDCVNNGGNTSNSEDPKNPNAGKGDF